MRRFQGVFNTRGERRTGENGEEIERQRQLHSMLLGECWIVSRSFAVWYTDPKRTSQATISAIVERGARHNELLRRAYPDAKPPEEPPFLLVAESRAEIERKLADMYTIASRFRDRSRAKNTIAPASGV
jgi:hypothetical protein